MDYSQGSTVWVASEYDGCKQAVVIAQYPAAEKIVVEVNGTPEVVGTQKVFLSALACCLHLSHLFQEKADKASESARKFMVSALQEQGGADSEQ